MQFKKLLEKKGSIDSYILLFGANEEATKSLDSFHNFMREKYTLQEVENASFLERAVPQDVIDKFRPIYDIYRGTYKAQTGKELAIKLNFSFYYFYKLRLISDGEMGIFSLTKIKFILTC